jgi:hypothetical protein
VQARCTGALAIALATVLALSPGAASAQTAAQNVEVDPVHCWWRTTAPSVRMGESFGVVLTCSAVETEAARAVIDRARLGTASVQFPPYEVLGGTQSPDHVTTGRRFMQYEYTLRLVNENSFGVDVPIPEMAITYRIESRTGGDASVQGREQTYLLPPLSIRVASLVPESARHIRETSVPTLAEIGSREFRARLFRVLALILFSVAGLTLVLAIVRWFRQKRAGTETTARALLPDRAVIAAARREIGRVQEQARGGWTGDLVGQALAAARIVASYVAGQPVPQRTSTDGPVPGELSLTRGLVTRRHVYVAGATTAAALAALTTREAVGMHDALQSLTAVRYAAVEQLDSGALDSALAATARSAERVAARHTRLADLMASLSRTVRGWRPRGWGR